MTRKKKPQTKKAEPRKLKVKWEMPTTYSIQLDTIVLHPPPTSIEKCPRCDKKHKRIEPKKLGKPMEFYAYDPPPSAPKKSKVASRPEAKPTPRLVSRASYWAVCPKTKEPIVLFDRVDAGESILNIVTKRAVDDICKAEDAKFLSEISSVVGNTKTTTKAASGEVLEKRGKWVKKTGKRGQEVWVPDPSKLEVKATMSDMTTWVYNPNAPERMVPGTKAEAKAQRARVRAQEKAAKPAREAARKERKR